MTEAAKITLEAAKKYIDIGWVLTPIPHKTKAPKLPRWNTPEVWVDSKAKAERAFSVPANMGVILEPSGICVLDVDHLEYAKLIFSEFGFDYDFILKYAPRIKGAKKNRDKAIFRLPKDHKLSHHKLTWGNKQLSVSVFELRCGLEQDVLPPSIHPDGHAYEWGMEPFSLIPEMPLEILRLWVNFDEIKPRLEALNPLAKPTPQPKMKERSGDHQDLIGKFNEKHPIEDILEANGYKKRGNRFLAPSSKSGLAGVVIFNDGKCFSQHASDPLNDKHAHDSFDVFRILKHSGDFTQAVKEAAAILGVAFTSEQKKEYAKAQGGEAAQNKPEEWTKPICFLEKIALPKFPSDCLPDSLRGYVESVAECRQVPVDLPAMLALAVGATAGARKYRVYIGESHNEPLNLWTVSALPPGSRKTDVFEDLVMPIYIEQTRRIQDARPAIEAAKALQKLHEKRMEHVLNQAVKEKNSGKREDLETEYSAMGQTGIKVPAYPCLVASGDTTPEAAAALLEEQRGRIAIMDTEGGLFSMIAGRYDSKGETNLDVWLKMHSGDELSIHRKNRPPIEVPKPAGTIAITVQPAVIKDLATKADFKARGLLGRFLYAIPESLVGTRFYQNRHVDQAAKDTYLAAIKRIFEQPEAEPRDGNDKAPHHRLYIRGEALEIWTEFYNDLETRQARGGDLESITDWASKCAAAIARIAGVFHIIETGGDPTQDEISVETMVRAYEIGRTHLIDHAKAAYGLMNMTADSHLARDIIKWIAAKSKQTFTIRDFWVDNRNKMKNTEEGLPAFEILEDQGIVREIHEKEAAGRRAKHKYEINPACRACFRCLKDE